MIGLNPSTADAARDDPTIRRCIGLARRWGFGGITVVNLFAFRATKPADLKTAFDPVGPRNDSTIRKVIHGVPVIAAWGTHGGFGGRDRAVLKLLCGHPRVFTMGLTKQGHPRHPLYVRYDTLLIPFAVSDQSRSAK